MRLSLTLLLCSWFCAAASAHDTWVETNTNLVRTGDAVYIDLKLGNHGNSHRDFKLASKIRLDGSTLDVRSPDGEIFDLTPLLVDVGYAPNEGYWTGKFATTRPGLHMIAHSRDGVVNHGRPVRSIKSGKTCFVVSDKLDSVSMHNPGFDTVFGHPLELVPVTNPVTPMGPGQELTVRLLFKGQPLTSVPVSFIPRRDSLNPEFDDRYERMTDAAGHVSFTPRTGDQYLVVAHHHAPDEAGPDYETTSYSATLTVFVPEICPCCSE
ncbi:MAG: DUF4198 domain-containing protein [Planctomycetaceae bacterium]|nr:DUF4198 domain-containing protein [Planctomycetaceae bacterium]